MNTVHMLHASTPAKRTNDISSDSAPTDILTEIPNVLRADVLVFDDSGNHENLNRRYATIPVCYAHAIKRIGPARASEAPKAIEDEMRYCADCVIDHGYAFHVHVSYFKRGGKFSGSGDYLTRKAELFRIFEEFAAMRRADVNPGGSYGNCPATLDVFAHPQRHPALFSPARTS